MAEEKEELVHVEELVWEEEEGPDKQPVRKRVMRLGNSLEVSRAEAVEGVKAGNYRIVGHPIGKVPEKLEQAKGGKRKVAEAAETNG